MNNNQAWEKEYQKPKFLTLGTEPLSDVKDFVKWMRRKQGKNIAECTVLDLGCGNGKNVKYLIEGFCKEGVGYDISETAINQARTLCKDLPIMFEVRSIGETLPLRKGSVDIVLDATSSNSLSETERVVYLKEVCDVLKEDGYFFVRALCRDGDENAKRLVKDFPGVEKDTYQLPEVGVTERIFSQEDFKKTYELLFEILFLEKTTGYQKWGNQSYKRNYWVAYLKKR
jgi:SAM-dependent methyltransferase